MKWFKWMWLPLSFGVLINYIFGRGLVMFSKTALVPPTLITGLTYYFIAAGISMGIVGILCDKVNARKIFLGSSIAGALSLLFVQSIPLAFGVLLGVASAVAKLAPMTAPTKLIDRRIGLNLVPQAMAKSSGGMLFPLLYFGLLVTVGWTASMAVLALLYVGIGIWIYKTIPDDYVEGWNIKEAIHWVKSWEIWAFVVSFVAMWVCWMLALREFMPSIKALGYSMVLGATLLSMGQWAELLVRAPAGWLGDKIGYGKAYAVGVLQIIAYPLMSWIPFVALFMANVGSGFGTPTMFPLARRLVGKANIATLFGIVYVLAYLITGFAFGFKK